MLEYFIAKRYLRSKHRINLISIISLISTAGIAIGVAALIIVISVFNGFGSLVTNNLINFDPHIRISTNSNTQIINTNIDSILGSIPGIQSFNSYVESKAVFFNQNSSTYEILNLKGLTSNKNNSDWGIQNKLRDGSFNLSETGGIPDFVVSWPVAYKLNARIGDTISVTSLKTLEKLVTKFALPKSKRFVLSGLFETNNKEYDLLFAFTSISAAQKALGFPNKISGYEIRLNKIDDAENIKRNLQKIFSADQFTVRSWFDLHKDLYTMMLIERWGAFIILCLIIAVASFNILGSLTMSVIEKKKDIGVLRSMGLNNTSILRIFMFEGMLIGIIGTAIGLMLGLLVCYIHLEFNLYSLDASKYIMDSLPLELRFFDIVIICLTSLGLSTFASLYPAKRAAKIQVVESIKWE